MDRTKKEERKLDVLGHIVYSYVHTAVPVSSKTVSRDMESSISSATVRNIMSELEEEGYIEQPHTSAGRIPTSIGYRSYAEVAKVRIKLERAEAERLISEYDKHIRTMKEVIEKTSFLISRQLQNAGIVMWPSIDNLYLKHIELIKIKAETVLAILVTMTNAVKNYIINLEEDIEKADLEKITNYINDSYEPDNLSNIAEKLRERTSGSPETANDGRVKDFKRTAVSIIDAIFSENIENEICCDGLNHFIEESKFRDLDATQKFLQVFSERKDITRIMTGELPYSGIKIYIGEDNMPEALKDCSVITSGYNLNGRTVGRLGVIGPMRMDYDRALGTIRSLSDIISKKLEEING
ncbi:MAG: heat-inducible transcriptional repressor HrcA [Candidatus Aadella gelida]|nr:heat-inducible transcriptional repressor HrcA [Candidatus Aadella gelida]